MIMPNISSDVAAFNEDEWLRLLFLLNDTQVWLDELINKAFLQLPVGNKRRLFRKTYYITVRGLAHLLEKHYYKIQRYPGAGKFTIPLTDILTYLRDAFQEQPTRETSTTHIQRTVNAGRIIGFDCNGQFSYTIIIITDSGGRIVTAFPGKSADH